MSSLRRLVGRHAARRGRSALERVWSDKRRLGWTADTYGQTRVWRNTREWTAADVPALFHCGRDSASDCAPQP